MNSGSRFLSIRYIARRAADTWRRFPYTLTSAFIGTAIAIYMVERGAGNPPQTADKVLLACILGLSLFTALSTFAERTSWGTAAKKAFPAVGILILLGYYLTLPERISKPDEPLVRFLLLILASHFLVAFLPFLGKGDRPGYWQYNKSIFLRILLAHLYFEVLFAGLSLALLAADKLFGLNVDGDTYLDLAIVLAGVFQTWVFLAGIPANLGELNRSEEYPPGLKVFTQFILLPLVALYFLILITYEAKILATGNWPEGWVAYLVLWYSVVSILSLLLLHPLQTREGSRWIAAFGNWFFRGLVPLLAMLYFAIYQRISEYGVTVNRFLVVNMAVGLTLVVLYFVFGRSRDIRVIPVVLCFLALVSAYGPFSAFAISQRSQRHRLAGLMTKNGILDNGAVRMAPQTVSEDDRREMSSIIDYLLEWHGSAAFGGWLDPEFLSKVDEEAAGGWRDSLAHRMGFAYQPQWRSSGDRAYFYFNADDQRQKPLPLHGWTYLIDYSYSVPADALRAFSMGGDSCYVSYDSASTTIQLAIGLNRAGASRHSSLDLADHIRSLQFSFGGPPIEPDSLKFMPNSGDVECLWLFEHISGSKEAEHLHVDHMTARLLIGGE